MKRKHTENIFRKTCSRDLSQPDPGILGPLRFGNDFSQFVSRKCSLRAQGRMGKHIPTNNWPRQIKENRFQDMNVRSHFQGPTLPDPSGQALFRESPFRMSSCWYLALFPCPFSSPSRWLSLWSSSPASSDGWGAGGYAVGGHEPTKPKKKYFF